MRVIFTQYVVWCRIKKYISVKNQQMEIQYLSICLKILRVLEPGGIDHSESSRNNQSELIRNSQCTCLAISLSTIIR